MTDAVEQRIRERAYEIWMATGCKSGLADLHWLSAERAVMSEAPQAAGAARKPAKPRAARAALPATVAVRKRVAKAKGGQA